MSLLGDKVKKGSENYKKVWKVIAELNVLC